MKRLAIVSLVLALTAGIHLVAQDDHAKKPAPDAGADMSAMMPKPGKEHAMLKGMIGTWDCEVEMAGMPGAPPTKPKAVEVVTPLGEFWAIGAFKGEMMGMPFEGHNITGYDPVKKKFTNYWVDSMSPSAMTGEGEWNEEKKELTFLAKGMDPMGNEMTMKQVVRIIDENNHTFTMTMPMPDGTEMTVISIKYTRAK